MSKRTIESNILYELQEVDTPGKLAPVQIALATSKGTQFILTPFAAADLARKLMRWAVFHDEEIALRYPSFKNAHY